MASGRRSPRRSRRLLASILLLSSTASVASAAVRVVRFTYVRGTGAEECPDEEAVRAGVAARLGYEAFDESAPARIIATVVRSGRTLEATIQVMDEAGRMTAERKLASQRNDCGELTSAMELAISIAIDPLGRARPRPPPEEPAAPPPAPEPPPPPAPVAPAPPAHPAVAARAPEPPARLPVAVQASAGAVGAIGSAPAPTFGATVQVSLRRGRLSLGLEGRADLPVAAPLRTGEVRTSLLAGSLAPCVHAGVLAGCLLASAGVLRASGHDLVDAQHVSAPFLGVGGRVALEVPATGSFLLRVHGDVFAPLTETVLRVSGTPVWTSSPVSAALGLAVGARFP